MTYLSRACVVFVDLGASQRFDRGEQHVHVGDGLAWGIVEQGFGEVHRAVGWVAKDALVWRERWAARMDECEVLFSAGCTA